MIVQFSELSALRVRHLGKSFVLGSGVFDLLHRGHIAYLKDLATHGDITVVMIKPDERVRIGKGPERPILPEEDRAAMVNAVKGVDYVLVAPSIDFRGTTIDPAYVQVIEALKPDTFYTTNPFWRQLEPLGIKVIIGTRPADESLRSTTAIIEHIHQRSSSKVAK
jgi:cytidyltransferase-like protein